MPLFYLMQKIMMGKWDVIGDVMVVVKEVVVEFVLMVAQTLAVVAVVVHARGDVKVVVKEDVVDLVTIKMAYLNVV